MSTSPVGAAVDPSTHTIYVADFGSNAVSYFAGVPPTTPLPSTTPTT